MSNDMDAIREQARLQALHAARAQYKKTELMAHLANNDVSTLKPALRAILEPHGEPSPFGTMFPDEKLDEAAMWLAQTGEDLT